MVPLNPSSAPPNGAGVGGLAFYKHFTPDGVGSLFLLHEPTIRGGSEHRLASQ